MFRGAFMWMRWRSRSGPWAVQTRTLDESGGDRRPAVAEPATQGEAQVLVPLAGLIVVIPAEGLGLFKDVEVVEVLEELVDKGGVELEIEGVAGQALPEVVEDGLG